LHAMRAVHRVGGGTAEVVLQAVGSEEDGGLGTFAALERDARFDGCLIPEPTGFDVVAAQAGALTFAGVVRGRSAHAAVRLEGCSAIDRYTEVHAALAAHERAINRDVAHPLMRGLRLPYPLSVGRLSAGAWSSQVPDEARFEGRVGVRVGETPEEARAALEAAVGDAAEIAWTGGQFEPSENAPDDPFVALVREAAAAELGREPAVTGVPYGSDMRLFRRHGIPCVMYGTRGLELAHAVDERVAVADVAAVARTIARLILRLA
jgi:acetylornithine deacetylase